MVHKDKLWIKFDENLDIECFCAYNNRRCPAEKRSGCGLYLAKFIPVDEPKKQNTKSAVSNIEQKLKQEQRKFETELKKSIKKLKGFKI
jgi:hypothetical protein